MSNYSENPKEASSQAGFYLPESDRVGQFDLNAEKYRSEQIKLANRVEDLTGVAFWDTKQKFAEYDYHLCKQNDPKKYFGVASGIPGIPMQWEIIDGIAELKYRQIASTHFKTTLIDADKLMKLKIRTRDMNTDSWIIWAFTDCDMYWKVDPSVNFHTFLGRNTQVTEPLKHEYKPHAFIPVSLLSVCSPEMFKENK